MTETTRMETHVDTPTHHAETYRQALDTAADAIFWATEDGRIVYANAEMARALGYTRDELLERSIFDIHPGTTANRWSTACESIRQSPSITYDATYRRKDGSQLEVEFRGSAIAIDGEFAVCAIVRNMSEGPGADRPSDLTTRRYRYFLQQCSEAVFCYEYDPPIPVTLPLEEQVASLYDGVLVECNDVAARAFGAERAEDALGKTFLSLFDHRPASIDRLFRLFVESGYRVVDGESWYDLPDGSTRYLLSNGVGEILDDQLIRVWGTYHDITDHKNVEHALQESERRFSAAFHANPVSMVIVSESDNILMVVNEAFLSFTGYDREEVLYRTPIEIDLWFDTDLFDRIKSRLSAGKPARRMETQLRTKSGELRYVSVAATALHEGDTDSILLVLRDITNQRRAEEALRRSEEIFAKVFRSTPHLVTITTLADGIFVDVNEAFERTTGYSRREIVGRRAVEMNVWDSESERRAFVAALAEHGRVRDMDVRWRIRSGETRLGRVSAEMIDVNSEPCIISVIQDVTERNKAEVALRQSEEMFATAFHSSPHLVAITSLESGELIDVNEGFERFSGYTRDEVIGRRTVDLNLWGQPELRDHFVDRLRSEGRVQDMESRLRTRDGEERMGLFSARPINVKGEDCIITVVQDITHRKKTEEALKDYAQRLQTLRDIDSAILASDSVTAIVEGATRHLFNLPGCIHVGCYIREVQGDRIRRVGGHTRREYNPEYMEVADHESVLGPVLGGHSLIVKDAKRAQAELAPTSADLIDEVGMGSFFMVPLTVKSQHIGALGVVFDQPNAFDESHVELAREIANPVAVAIERTRLQEELYRSNARLTTLSHKLVEAQESERHYLAHELHDHIGQMLTAAKLSMQQARDLAEEESLVDALDQHIKIMGDTLEQVRSLSLDLRPSLLDDFGLVPALKWLLDRTTVKDEFELALHADPGMARLPSDLEVTCFRVAQEAISNASRHAEAAKVDVNLERRPDRVILTIADDGCGFDVDEAYAHASAGRSLGLLSMSERVRLAGGKLDLHSVAGEGTVLSVELPILQDSSDHP